MSLMHIKQLLMSMSDFKDKGEMMVVSELSSLDMDPIEVVVVSNFLSPGLSDLGVFPLVAAVVVVVGVVVDSGEVLKDLSVDYDLLVGHFWILIVWI